MTGGPAGVAAAILAGGRATRMSEPGVATVVKAHLVVDGQRIIDRQLAILRPRFAEVLIAANDPAPWQGLAARIVSDRALPIPSPRSAGGGLGRGAPHIGPIAGLDAALAALPDGIDAVVCVASDMPFLGAALLEHLRDASPGAVALVPRVAGRAEPLLARYARAVAPVVAEQIAAGRYAMVDLLARLDVIWLDEPALRALDPALRSIVNVNTPEELTRLERLAGLAHPDPTGAGK